MHVSTNLLMIISLLFLVSCNGGDAGKEGAPFKTTSSALSVKEVEVDNLNASIKDSSYKLSSEDLAYLQSEGVISKSDSKKLGKFEN